MTQPRDEYPRERRSPIYWVTGALVVAVVAFIAILQWLGADEEAPPATDTVNAPTLAPTTSTSTVATTSPPTTAPATTATTQPPETISTTEPAATDPDGEVSTGPAIGQLGMDIVWVEPDTGETEVAHPAVFEASSADKMALGADGSSLYYQLIFEDYWFSCETAQGEVTVLDVDSGAVETIDQGRPALSPNGERLAYLAAEECFADPEQPEFFLMAYDTLVLADPNGTEQTRIPLSAADDAGPPLVDLVWADSETLLVTDLDRAHYRIPADEPVSAIRDQDPLDLPDLHIYAVVEERALAAEFDSRTGPGPLLSLDLSGGETQPIDVDASGFYAVGVSDGGEILISTPDAGGDPSLLVDVDLNDASVGSIVPAQHLSAVDW